MNVVRMSKDDFDKIAKAKREHEARIRVVYLNLNAIDRQRRNSEEEYHRITHFELTVDEFNFITNEVSLRPFLGTDTQPTAFLCGKPITVLTPEMEEEIRSGVAHGRSRGFEVEEF